MAGDVVVDLPGAEDETAYGVVVGGRIVQHLPERALGKVSQRRGRLLQTEKALRRHHDQRPCPRLQRLTAQQVEVLSGSRAVRDADVLLRRALEEPLETRARVLRPVALVAVREEQGQSRELAPLGEPGGDELVDDDLRPVHEVPELRLPADERLRRRDRVAVLEADRRVLGQRRVVHLERRCRLAEMLDRRVALAVVHVVKDEVTVREGAALGVLACQPDGNAFHEERRERERLGLSPVDSPGRIRAGHRRHAAPELAGELRMDREALRDGEQLLVQLAEALGRDRGGDRGAPC